MHALTDDRLSMDMAGEAMVLLGDRALYWPARERLIIADLHLGKDHVFRQAGIPVPQGTTEGDLQRLSDLLALSGARAVWVVGDVLHGPAPHPALLAIWHNWRDQHQDVDLAVLAGNHDRALSKAALDVRILGEQVQDGPFLFQHLPQLSKQGLHVIAGHVHPKVRLKGVPRSWPAFWLKPGLAILPAFSDFTGGVLAKPERGETLVACVDTALVVTSRGR